MPKGTELHVGFFAPQSKHIYIWDVNTVDQLLSIRTTDLIGGLCLKFGKYLLRLSLGCERHGDS